MGSQSEYGVQITNRFMMLDEDEDENNENEVVPSGPAKSQKPPRQQAGTTPPKTTTGGGKNLAPQATNVEGKQGKTVSGGKPSQNQKQAAGAGVNKDSSASLAAPNANNQSARSPRGLQGGAPRASNNNNQDAQQQQHRHSDDQRGGHNRGGRGGGYGRGGADRGGEGNNRGAYEGNRGGDDHVRGNYGGNYGGRGGGRPRGGHYDQDRRPAYNADANAAGNRQEGPSSTGAPQNAQVNHDDSSRGPGNYAVRDPAFGGYGYGGGNRGGETGEGGYGQGGYQGGQEGRQYGGRNAGSARGGHFEHRRGGNSEHAEGGSNSGDGFDNRGKRQFDRAPGNGGPRKFIEKKDGAGVGNWGVHVDLDDAAGGYNNQEGEVEGGAPEAAGHTGDRGYGYGGDRRAQPARTEDSIKEAEEKRIQREKEDKQITLEEFKREREKNKVQPQYNIRKPGEGEDSSWREKGTLIHESKKAPTEKQEDETKKERSGAGSRTGGSLAQELLGIHYAESNKVESRGGARGGGRGRGEGRGYGGDRGGGERSGGYGERDQRDYRGGDQQQRRGGGAYGRGYSSQGKGAGQPVAPRIEDTTDFPALGPKTPNVNASSDANAAKVNA